MGTGNLTKLASPPTEVESSTDDLNQILDALYGDIVMRNTSGVVTDGAGDIGKINSGRPDRIHVKTAITIGGQTLNTAPFLLSKTGVQSGAAKTSGFPNFLSPAGGTGLTFDILGATTPLNMTIDGDAKTLKADLTSDDLTLAPSSNNTCLVNNTVFLDHEWTKTIGEYDFWITIDTIGSEITALNGTTQCFKHGSGPEIFIAKVDTSNNKLVPILRGIGGTTREVMIDNDIITLLKSHYIFLSNDLLTIDTSTVYPTWGPTAPSTPATGQYWWDTDAETWKRYSGSTWETLHRIYLGYAICDSAGCKWVEHVDFDLAWNATLDFDKILNTVAGGTNLEIQGKIIVNVAGVSLNLDEQTLDISNNYADGESFVNARWGYLYISKTGNFYLSNIAPRKKNWKLGYYHPNEYWRCISLFYTNYGTGFEKIDHSKNENNIMMDKTLLSSIGGVDPTLVQFCSPLINKTKLEINAQISPSGFATVTFDDIRGFFSQTLRHYADDSGTTFEHTLNIICNGLCNISSYVTASGYVKLKGLNIDF